MFDFFIGMVIISIYLGVGWWWDAKDLNKRLTVMDHKLREAQDQAHIAICTKRSLDERYERCYTSYNKLLSNVEHAFPIDYWYIGDWEEVWHCKCSPIGSHIFRGACCHICGGTCMTDTYMLQRPLWKEHLEYDAERNTITLTIDDDTRIWQTSSDLRMKPEDLYQKLKHSKEGY